MKTYKVEIRGVSDLCFGKHVAEKKTNSETHEQFEERTWKDKIHADSKTGQCFIQPFAIKNALESAARWLSMSIPGEGKKTFTKRFTSGVIVSDRLMIHDNGSLTKREDVEGVPMFVPSDGKRGSSKRVIRVFPIIHEWETEFEIVVLDDKISKEVLAEHLDACGKFIGLGSMRVENGGVNGRFAVTSVAEVG